SVFLLYFVAAEALIFGNPPAVRAVFGGSTFLVQILTTAGGIAAGYGIANERKWGYLVGLAVAVLPLAARLYVAVKYQVSPLSFDVLGLLFEGALVALLVHPQSRDYQRIWFK
ncbi:MAG: hypothetical protein ACYDAD_03295, partial [Acidimicrobiales bacterium]